MEGYYHQIAFCITCMNRIYQLKKTLLKNIRDNEDYQNLEFILLDYNSVDGMEAWAKKHFSVYINNGRLKYYKTFEPTFFNHSHAKNLAVKLSGAEIVCNINADHYTGKGFANYVNDAFNKNERIVITPIPQQFYTRTIHDPAGELWGKFCIKKNDFLNVGGFDERMMKFGNDDIDLINRLNLSGVSSFLLNKPQFGHFISHDNEIRYSTKKKINELRGILINYLDPSSSDLIFLFNDLHFEKFILIDTALKEAENCIYSFNERCFRYRYEIKDLDWLSGIYVEKKHDITFSANKLKFLLQKEYVKNSLIFLCTNTKQSYYIMIDTDTVNNLLELNYVFYNLNIMLKNLEEQVVRVNNEGFGKAKVYKNFNYENPLLVE